LIKSNFTFDADCSYNRFDETTEFQLVFHLKDQDPCNFNKSSKLVMNLTIELPENNAPTIKVDQNIKDIDLRIGESLSIPVLAEDIDGDLITLFAQGIDFSLSNFGIIFEQKQGNGKVTSTLAWNPGCDINPIHKDNFQIRLVAKDDDLCLPKQAVTVLNINLKRPNNEKPEFVNQINRLNNIVVGETVEFDILTTDRDGDQIFLDLLNREHLKNTYGIEFDPASGKASATSSFKYIGDCSHLGESYGETQIDLVFVVRDEKCYNPKSDTLSVKINLSDVEAKTEQFLPPNVFSPNGDEYNQYFTMPNLPNNNCHTHFVNIKIYNRWGIQVFTSDHRDFAWDGGDYPTGLYFYVLTFTKNKYKGYVSILK
jgi:gliding motility-associated-like protein